MIGKLLRMVFAASDLLAGLFLLGSAMIGFTGGGHASVTPEMVLIGLLFAAYGVGFCISARDVSRGLPRQRWLRPMLYGFGMLGLATIIAQVLDSEYQRTEASIFFALLAISGIGHLFWIFKRQPVKSGP